MVTLELQEHEPALICKALRLQVSQVRTRLEYVKTEESRQRNQAELIQLQDLEGRLMLAVARTL